MILQNSLIGMCIGLSVALHGLVISSADVYTVFDGLGKDRGRSTLELISASDWQGEELFSSEEASTDLLVAEGMSVQEEMVESAETAGKAQPLEKNWEDARREELNKFKTQAEMGLFVSYYRMLSLLIQQQIQYPESAKTRGFGGSVYLAFTIDAEGTLVEVMVKRSSGHSLLDETALRAVKRAAPFPRLPQDLEQQELNFYLPIFFKKYLG
jgi:TonB family protein